MSDLILQIANSVKELIEVRETNLGIEAVLPVAYSGGDLVEVVIENVGNEYTAHDSGFGMMRVTRSGLPLTRLLVEKSKELAARFDCLFSNSRVTKTGTLENIGVVVSLVANASRAIADQAVEARKHLEYEFRREAVERVREFAGLRLRENQEYKGGSGRTYRVPALVLDRSLSHPQHFVAALATRSVVLNHVAEFLDLHDAHAEVKNEALYDDNSDFRQEDYALLSRVSQPIPLSQSRQKLQSMFQ